jgi:hypothetical protein
LKQQCKRDPIENIIKNVASDVTLMISLPNYCWINFRRRYQQ